MGLHVKIGYARVSTDDQNLDLQLIALKKAGCDHIFTDYGISGQGFDRPGLSKATSVLTPGDTLVVWRLDRLGRSLPKLIQLVEDIGNRNAQFSSLTENIDTSSSGGRLIFHIMGALAEFERTLISERTRAGMDAARLRGIHVGRRPSLGPSDVIAAQHALATGEHAETVAQRFSVTSRTLRRHLKNMSKID
ncbi:recombinase family protein [Brucella pituitosa]|uniref:Recombinase family protein n=1 Tax=Brucella pituitosa TaxID=571256 RepID=A0A643EV54_9HYPH|nr:recombinase family protein [Brucella pituitosa]KAB0566155.1 recombinase family protein [Brucella pituitosa]